MLKKIPVNIFTKFNSKYLILIILFIALTLRLGALFTYGLTLSLNSDDAGYTQSAVIFLEKGMLTYHDVNTPTVHIMPGQTLLLALVFFFFGHGDIGIYAAKLLIILLGVINVYLLYLIGKYIGNLYIGLISSFMLAIFIPQVLTDNLLLTETPFLTCLLGMVYFSIRLANEHKMKYFFLLMLSYLLGLMFKATIALFPILLLFYLILKKYPFRLAVKQFFIALCLLLTVLGPWWIRNYIHYEEFIPLTGGSGNPLLLGTYQGFGYKYGESYDDVLKQIAEKKPSNAYENLKLQEEAAKERIKNWWNEDKSSFIKSYVYLKSKVQWTSQFYWIEIFNFTKEFINSLQKYIVILAGIASLLIPFMKKRWKEYTFLISLIIYNTLLNNIFFAYDRYNQPLMFILFLLISTGLVMVLTKLFKKRSVF